MSDRAHPAASFDHVEAWVFDLDNTLYPADCNLFAQIDKRMGQFIADRLGLPLQQAQALREAYYYRHGTTLAGLVRLHGVAPDDFLDYVHDIDLGAVLPSPALAAALASLPGRKFIFTNGSRKHAEAVATRLGVSDQFDDICDIHALDYIYPKPMREAYERFVTAHGVDRAAAPHPPPHRHAGTVPRRYRRGAGRREDRYVPSRAGARAILPHLNGPP
jgi:putative hydrolase of the HAD superfamily